MRSGRPPQAIPEDTHGPDHRARVNSTPPRRHTSPEGGHNEAPQSLEEFILDRFLPTLINPRTGRKVGSGDGEP